MRALMAACRSPTTTALINGRPQCHAVNPSSLVVRKGSLLRRTFFNQRRQATIQNAHKKTNKRMKTISSLALRKSAYDSAKLPMLLAPQWMRLLSTNVEQTLAEDKPEIEQKYNDLVNQMDMYIKSMWLCLSSTPRPLPIPATESFDIPV